MKSVADCEWSLVHKSTRSLEMVGTILIHATVSNHYLPQCGVKCVAHCHLRRTGYCQRFKEDEVESLIQVKRRKRIKDKCQKKKNEEANWCTTREGRDITGGTGTKMTCQRERATRRADVQMRGGWSTGCTCKLIKQCSI